MTDPGGEQERQPSADVWIESWMALQDLEHNLLRSGLDRALDDVDYNRLRKLGYTIRAGHLASGSRDWDLPPVDLQQIIAAVSASSDVLAELHEKRVLHVIAEHSTRIQLLLSPDVLPAEDGRILEKELLDQIVEKGRRENHLQQTEGGLQLELRISESRLAEKVVVRLDVSQGWEDRPRVDEKVGARRRKLLSIARQITAGGLLAVTNMGLAVATTLSGSLPALTGAAIPAYVALATSTYTGVNGALASLKELASASEEQD